MKKSKTIRKIKEQQYWGLRTQIAKELTLKTHKVDDVFRGKCKDALIVAKVRRVATLLIDNYNEQLNSIS